MILNVFMMRTQETGLPAAVGKERCGSLLYSYHIVTDVDSELQGEKE